MTIRPVSVAVKRFVNVQLEPVIPAPYKRWAVESTPLLTEVPICVHPLILLSVELVFVTTHASKRCPARTPDGRLATGDWVAVVKVVPNAVPSSAIVAYPGQAVVVRLMVFEFPLVPPALYALTR